jgi:ribosomal protein L11 methylase PrmA
MIESARSEASFRDPSGFIFDRGRELFRQVNLSYKDDYDRLIGSGLYAELVGDGLLIPHKEVDAEPAIAEAAYRVLRPERVPFVSYPYEWCFGQYRDAALLTLEVQRRAIGAGMSLKDASAYNVQFRGARPVFIDTLSFEAYHEGEPWVAYRQFCQHFLAPVALMSRVDVRLPQILRANIDGVPMDLASRLLPWRTRFNPGLLMHVHLHARLQGAHGGGSSTAPRRGFGRRSMLGLIDHLASTIRGLRWSPEGEWAGYTEDNTYSAAAHEHKRKLVAEFLEIAGPSTVWDLGANTGEYSRIASGRGSSTVSFDLDPACVERNYIEAARDGEAGLLPLVLDLANPSPGLGWRNRERASLTGRGPADLVLALALIHHLAIANNLPFPHVVDFFHEAGRWLVVEFVPKDDPQVGRLLRSRRDIFDAYNLKEFEASFRERFAIHRAEPIAESGRVLYLMQGTG